MILYVDGLSIVDHRVAHNFLYCYEILSMDRVSFLVLVMFFLNQSMNTQFVIFNSELILNLILQEVNQTLQKHLLTILNSKIKPPFTK